MRQTICKYARLLAAAAPLVVYSHASTADANSTEVGSQEATPSEKKRIRPLPLGSAAKVRMLPRWEVGVGALQLNTKDYPGSDNDNNRTFVLPYAVYRGDKLRIGEGGVKALAFENSRLSLTLSLAASVNANSAENPLRQGLPDIDYMFELGPQLVMTIFDTEHADGTESQMKFSTQLRAAFSTDFSSLESRGAVLSTVLDWERGGYFNGKLGVFASVAPTWATEELHDVFYQVDPEYVNENRSSYDAQGGYMGTDTSIGVSYNPHPSVQVFAAVGQKFYTGTANEDSPLFETDSSNSYYLGLLWKINSSKELVAVLRD